MDKKDYTVDCLYDPPPKPLSDYERIINKQHSAQMSAQTEEAKKCGKQVAQLGEQEVQSIAPLIVPSDKAAQQMHEETSYDVAPLAYKYVHGQPLVMDPKALTTQLWNLHNWYMTAAKEGKTYFLARVQEHHLFREYDVQVKFEELFQMYNQRALDKPIISCYCL